MARTGVSRRELLGSAWVLGVVSYAGIGPRFAWGQASTLSASGIVDAALGHSVLYQEMKGDFAAARRIADAALRAARPAGDAARLADALYASGLVSLLRGDAAASVALFDELSALLRGDVERLVLARSYATAAAVLHLNTAPDGTTAEGEEIGLRQSAQGASRLSMWERMGERAELAQRVQGTSTSLLSNLIAANYTVLPLVREMGQHQGVFGGDRLTLAQQLLDGPWSQAQTLGDPGVLACVVAAAADAYGRAGDGRAAQLRETALQLYRQKGDVVGEGTIWLLEGDAAAAPRSSPLTRNYSIAVLGGADSKESQAEARELDASIDLARARSAYDTAEALFRQGEAPRGLAALKLRASYLAACEDDHAQAAVLARDAAQRFETCGDALGAWTARTHHALARIGAGELLEDRAFARALGEWGAGPGSFSYALGLAHVCGRAGRHWLLGDGDYERALASHRLAEAAYTTLGVGILAAQSVVDQAGVYRAVGAHVLANEAYHKAIAAYASSASARPALAAPVLSRELTVGLDLWRNYEATRDADGMQWAAAELQKAVDRAGALETEAGSVEEMALSLQARLASSIIAQSSVLVPSYRGVGARDRGDSAEAERMFRSALAAAASAPADADPAFLEAIAQGHRKDYPAAQRAYERYYEQVTGPQSGAGDDLLSQVRRALEALGQTGQAAQDLQHAHELALAFYTNIEAFEAAQTHLTALEQQAGKEWWTETTDPWLSLSDIGRTYRGTGRGEQAAEYFQRAIDTLESRRERLHIEELKVGLAAASQPQWLYFDAASNALERAAAGNNPGLAAQAFQYAEHGKARALLDLMAGGLVSTKFDAATGADVATWRRTNAKLTALRGLLGAERAQTPPDEARIAYLATQIDALETELRPLEARLARSDPSFYQVVNPQAAVLDVAAIAARLPPGTALLQYFFLGDELLAWAIDGSGIIASHRAEIDAVGLVRDIRALHAACEQRGAVDAVGERLAQALLAPFAAVLATHADLVVVPYGASHLLPFHALPWQGAPLAATHSLRYLPSASTLQFVGGAGSQGVPEEILAIGNPARMKSQDAFGAPGTPAPALPGAEAEARIVAASFPKGQALIGAAATATAVRDALPRYRLVHFATHGELSESAPLLSSILLADGSALTVYELFGLRLQADLVVLSACRTGQGTVTKGDDLLGLTRGLLAAGAKAAVVSLWPVDDFATSLFMEHFYATLRAGAPAHRALQAAQNHVRGLDGEAIRAARSRMTQAQRGIQGVEPAGPDTGYSHPFYWSPFVLVT